MRVLHGMPYVWWNVNSHIRVVQGKNLCFAKCILGSYYNAARGCYKHLLGLMVGMPATHYAFRRIVGPEDTLYLEWDRTVFRLVLRYRNKADLAFTQFGKPYDMGGIIFQYN